MNQNILDSCLIVLESLAFGLNILTLYLIYKMGLKSIDMWLSVIIAVCDLILSGFKIIQLSVLLSDVENSLLYNLTVNAPLNGMIVFITMCSVTSVVYLSIVRWLVICRGCQLDRLRYVTLVYLTHAILFFFIITLGISNGGFRKLKDARFYTLDSLNDNPWGYAVRLMLTINLSTCFLIFNGCYMLLARQYWANVGILASRKAWLRNRDILKDKLLVVFKIAVIVSFYNSTVLPRLVVNLIELITATSRGYTAQNIASSSLICIALVNPIVLITMHCETRQEFTRLMRRFGSFKIRS